MSVKEIIAEYLRTNGYDGLCYQICTEEACGCPLDDLMPCGEDPSNCQPGFRCSCNCGDGDHKYHIEEKRE